jgi:uncharacterized delta-60 repeat protein
MNIKLSKTSRVIRTATIGLLSLLFALGAQVAQATQTGGTLDTTFNSGGVGFDALTQGVALQPDGKVIVGGNFTTYNGAPAAKLIRLNADGSVDSSFQMGSGLIGQVQEITLLSDGSMLIGGRNMTSYNGVTVSSIFKLSSTGTLDQNFTSNIGSITGGVSHIKQLADGKFVATGTISGGILKFDSNGAIDSTFATNLGAGFTRSSGPLVTSVLNVVQQSSGNLVLVGTFNSFKGTGISNGIASLTNDGQLVSSFQTNVGNGLRNNTSDGFGTSLALLSSGKIIVGGNFDRLDSSLSGNFIAINADGTHFASFNAGGAGFSRQVESISLDANENMFVALQIAGTYNGTAVPMIVRLLSNGVLDSTFSAATLNLTPFKTVPTPSGGLYVTGVFTTYGGVNVGRFMRLETGVSPTPSPTPSPTLSPQPSPNSDATLANTGVSGSSLSDAFLFGGILISAGVLTVYARNRSKKAQ